MNEFLKKNANPNLLVGQIFSLMPLTDLHLKSDYEGEPTTTNSMSNIYSAIEAQVNWVALQMPVRSRRTFNSGFPSLISLT